jgi:hypothetical protein
MGTSGSQRRGFRRTRAGAGGVPAVGGRGGGLVPQVARTCDRVPLRGTYFTCSVPSVPPESAKLLLWSLMKRAISTPF